MTTIAAVAIIDSQLALLEQRLHEVRQEMKHTLAGPHWLEDFSPWTDQCAEETQLQAVILALEQVAYLIEQQPTCEACVDGDAMTRTTEEARL